jgi:hypothetical protein
MKTKNIIFLCSVVILYVNSVESRCNTQKETTTQIIEPITTFFDVCGCTSNSESEIQSTTYLLDNKPTETTTENPIKDTTTTKYFGVCKCACGNSKFEIGSIAMSWMD